MNRVWPGAVVMDNTLQVHAAAVRKALGPYRHLLKTESGRGYRLLGHWIVRHHDATRAPAGFQRMRVDDDRLVSNVPAAIARLFGRAAAAARLRDLVSAYRAVTLTGPGGIGKTSLALKVARRILGEFADGGWLVELAPLSDPGLVPSALAHVLGLELSGEPSAEAVARGINEKHILLVFDNCEHVIDAVAILTETILRLCPHVTIMSTSREVLRVQGEHIYRVPPLEVPSDGHAESGEILGRSGVELFIARAKALDSRFSPAAEELPMIAAICRHLDGIPLAIEFAAARSATLGIHSVATGLSDRFALLTTGRRTALPRHRTLRAALDWSYNLLHANEQAIFRRLGIFHGAFSMEAAQAVISKGETLPDDVVKGIADLIDKSLVAANTDGDIAYYQLLETTRAYALERLQESGELPRLSSAHAAYFHRLFRNTEMATDSVADHNILIHNCRAALDWAFSPSGDTAIAAQLTAALTPLWVQMSLMSECRKYAERALANIATNRDQDARTEMVLKAALGASLTYTTGPVPETAAAWSETLRLAERLGDAEFRLRALRGLWSFHMNAGQYRNALAHADAFCTLAEQLANPLTTRAGARMVGLILHYLGDQDAARKRIDDGADTLIDPSQGPPTPRFMIDQDVARQALLARIVWLQGFPSQAVRLAQDALERAADVGHVISRCHALAQAVIPVSLWIGDIAKAKRMATDLIDLASTNLLEGWVARGKCFAGALAILDGHAAEGSIDLERGLQELSATGSTAEYPAFLAILAHGRAITGQIDAAHAAVDQAIEWSQRTEEGWCAAELLRHKGEVLLMSSDANATAAEAAFRHSLDIARRHGALSWELRTVMSLARLWQVSARRHEARELLASVYDRFSEGFETADLRAARSLINELA